MSSGIFLNSMWLVKTDAHGGMQWNQTYGGLYYSEEALALVQTIDGGYALAGYTGSFGAGMEDFWLVKTDEFGVIPEFPSILILPLFMTATLLMALVSGRKHW